MKILYLHAHYQQKGGEDAVFQEEYALLSEVAEVRSLTFQNKGGWRGAVQFLVSVWNLSIRGKLVKQIRLARPDVIHIHNWHFAIGPLAIRAAKKKKIPVVLTLHNYRLICPSATLSHKGRLFLDSVHASFPWKAVASKVYRNSAFQTFWLAFVVWYHKRIGTWQMADKYIVLTDFAKTLFGDSSMHVPMEKFVVKSNFVTRSGHYHAVQPARNGFLFIGRLSEEKGVGVLLEAFRRTGYTLGIGGDGPLKDLVLKACSENEHIRYLGNLTKIEVENAMAAYEALIFPSTWYEGMPLTILEAFASGLPVIASNIGAMSAMIRDRYDGLLFEAGNPGDLADKSTDWRTLTAEEKETYGKNAYASYLERYTPEKNRETLLEIYHSVIGN
jgi:glycosyltransferase involved in cell wall biosynthesis